MADDIKEQELMDRFNKLINKFDKSLTFFHIQADDVRDEKFNAIEKARNSKTMSKPKKINPVIRPRFKCPDCNGTWKPFSERKKGQSKSRYQCENGCYTQPKRWMIDFFMNGKRKGIYLDKTGMALDSYDRAVQALNSIITEIETKTFDPSTWVKSEQEKFKINNLLARYLIDKLPLIAPSRQGHYNRYTEKALEFFGTRDVREIRRIDIADWKRYLISKYFTNQPKQGKTLKNVMDHFKSFLRFCVKEYEVLTVVPSFPEIELQPFQFQWVGQEDQQRIFEFIEDRHKEYVAFLCLHGCRPAEAAALRKKNLSFENKTITINATFSGTVYREKRKGKKAKAVVLPMHPEMFDILKTLCKDKLDEAYVFTNSRGLPYSKDDVYRLWEKTRKAAGLGKSLRFYEFTKHSNASQLVNAGVSIYKVASLLGITPKTAEKYAHNDLESLRTDILHLSLKPKTTAAPTLLANSNKPKK